MLGGLGQAADDAHQPLRPRRDGPAGAAVSHAQHVRISLQDGSERRHRYEQAGNHLSLRHMRIQAAIAAAIFSAACTSQAARPVSSPVSPAVSGSAWVDSVLTRLTLREKAAQMVWPTVFGDY